MCASVRILEVLSEINFIAIDKSRYWERFSDFLDFFLCHKYKVDLFLIYSCWKRFLFFWHFFLKYLVGELFKQIKKYPVNKFSFIFPFIFMESMQFLNFGEDIVIFTTLGPSHYTHQSPAVNVQCLPVQL